MKTGWDMERVSGEDRLGRGEGLRSEDRLGCGEGLRERQAGLGESLRGEDQLSPWEMGSRAPIGRPASQGACCPAQILFSVSRETQPLHWEGLGPCARKRFSSFN